MDYSSTEYRHASKRIVVYAKNGMVCSSHPLAAQAGLEMLKKGGSAADAAIATAAALTVLEPTCNGIGGDCFAIHADAAGHIDGLNASGYAPAALSAAKLKKAGFSEVPRFGWEAVTVPGQIGGWAALSKRYGKLPFADLFAPAIGYARDGAPIAPTVSQMWAGDFAYYSTKLTDARYKSWFDTFAQGGRAPRLGEIWRCPDMADSLEDIAATRGESFYRGRLAERFAAFAAETGGYITEKDLAAYAPEWVTPLKSGYRGYDIYELPPNNGGMIAQMALNILEGYDFPDRDDELSYHRQLEAMKLAFIDGKRYIADPRAMKADPAELLSAAYADRRRALIGEKARLPEPTDPSCFGTVYLCAADAEGNMISYIQSNYLGFGSGLVIPCTGIALQNRGHNFYLDETLENCLAPGKKPYHTILPAFLGRGGRPIGPFGVMGGFMQPQGHVQVAMNTIDFHLNPQDALNAPRWQWTGGNTIEVEPDFPRDIAEKLAARGHDIVTAKDSMNFGRGQIIWREENGAYAGATEPRTDGTVAAY